MDVKVWDGNADIADMTGDGERTRAKVLAVLVALLLVAGITSVLAVGPTPGASGNARAAGSGVSLLADETTTTPASPPTTNVSAPTTKSTRPTTSTTVRQAAPATTGTTAKSTASTVVARGTKANFAQATGVEIPFTPGQTSWTGVSNGVSITVHTDRATPRAGDVVQFDVELSSTDHVCCGLVLHFGDGAEFDAATGFACPGPQSHGPVSFHTSHIYNLDGRWTFGVAPITGNCNEPNVEAGLFGRIEVSPGVFSAQGPSLPTVSVAWTILPAKRQNDPSWNAITAMIDDADGWLRDVTVDWGDGSPPERVAKDFDGLPCQDNEDGWPLPTKKFIGDAMHHYTTVGVHTVTVTAVSTGCDGSMPQVGTGTIMRG